MNETQPSRSQQQVVRPRTEPCRCSYQKERTWVYRVFRWGGRRRQAWKPVGESSSLLIAYDIADKFDQVLIVCQGCGAEMLREYGPNAKLCREAGRKTHEKH